jgi:hypothetical protein
MRKNIFVFVGEFSYELNWYVPWLRKVCKTTYSKDYNIFYGRPKLEMLYADFISEYRVIPQELLNLLKYPSTTGERINFNNKHIIVTPYFITDYITHENVGCSIILPPHFNNRVENPDGEYIHYNPSHISNELIRDFFKKTNLKKENTILLMPKYRERHNSRPEDQNWKKENWELFVKRIIQDMNYNVVSLYFEGRDSSGGSYNLKIDSTKHFTIVNPSFDQQLALLKNTKYSIYGSTGANGIPFFTNTPMISYVLDIYGKRLFHKWQTNLTNNHEKQKIVLIDNLENYTIDQAYNELLEFEKKYKF